MLSALVENLEYWSNPMIVRRAVYVIRRVWGNSVFGSRDGVGLKKPLSALSTFHAVY